MDEVAAAASKLIRLNVDNYMVHVNSDDGSRVFIPYVGGLDRFNRTCRAVAADGFRGFVFGQALEPTQPSASTEPA